MPSSAMSGSDRPTSARWCHKYWADSTRSIGAIWYRAAMRWWRAANTPIPSWRARVGCPTSNNASGHWASMSALVSRRSPSSWSGVNRCASSTISTTRRRRSCLAPHVRLQLHLVAVQSRDSEAVYAVRTAAAFDVKWSRMAEPKRALAVRRRAVPLASVPRWFAAQRARRSTIGNESRAITRSVTHGTFDRGDHPSAPCVDIGERCLGGVDVPLRTCASLACLAR